MYSEEALMWTVLVAVLMLIGYASRRWHEGLGLGGEVLKS